MSNVSFPALGLSFELNRTAITIGGFEVYWYGIIIGVGMLIAMLYAFSKTKELGIDDDKFFDVIIVGIIAGVVGARAYYIIFSSPGQFNTFADIIDIRDGGLGFYGAVIFAFASVFFMCRYKKMKMLPILDITSIGFLLGQGLGRWGNFFNQEAFGTNTKLPWGMTSDTIQRYLTSNLSNIEAHGMKVDPSLPVHPTFLYESIWLLIGFLVLTLFLKKRRFDGELTLMFIAWNGAGRVFIEGLRTDSLYLGNIRISQLLAGVGVILSIGAIVFIRIKQKKSGDEKFLMPFGHTEEWATEYAAIAERQEQAKAKKETAKEAQKKWIEKENELKKGDGKPEEKK